MDFVMAFFLFGCVGVTLEILFTSFIDFNKTEDGRMKGTSYFWMFYIYGSIAFLFWFVYPLFAEWHVLLRLITYGVLILLAEYVYGFILCWIVGESPWKYTSQFNVHGLIRLDYFPLWAVVGYFFEWLYVVI